MLFKNLPPKYKVKVLLADSRERLAEDAVPHLAFDFLADADRLRAEVEAFVAEATR